MVCGVIWVDGVATRGAKAARGYEELYIVTSEKIYKKNTSRIQSSKANPVGRIALY